VRSSRLSGKVLPTESGITAYSSLCLGTIYMTTQHNKEKLTPLRSVVAQLKYNWPIPVAVRSTAWVYGRSLAGIAGSTPIGGMDVCLL
jgi:hypothetical protein